MSILKHSIYMSISNYVLLVSAYVLNVWVGRLLGPEAYGKYVVILGIFGIISVLFSARVITKVIAEDKNAAKPIVAELLLWSLPLLPIIALIYYYAIAPLIASALGEMELLFPLRLLTPVIPIYGIGMIYAGYFTGTERFGLQSIKMIIVALSKIAFVIGLVLAFFVNGAIVALSLTGMTGIIFSFFFIRVFPWSRRTGAGAQKVMRMAKLWLPMTAFSILLTFFSQMGIFLIKGTLADDALTGYFGVAKSIVQIPAALFTAINSVLLAAAARTYETRGPKETGALVMRSMKYLIIMAIPTSLFISATAGNIIRLIYGEQFIPGTPILTLIALGFVFFTVTGVLVTLIHAIGRPWMTVLIGAAMIAIHWTLGLLLIGFGATGVAVSYILASLTGCIAGLLYLSRHIGQVVKAGTLVKVSVLSVLLAIGLAAVPIHGTVMLIAAWAVAAGCYLAGLFLIGEMGRADIKEIARLLQHHKE